MPNCNSFSSIRPGFKGEEIDLGSLEGRAGFGIVGSIMADGAAMEVAAGVLLWAGATGEAEAVVGGAIGGKEAIWGPGVPTKGSCWLPCFGRGCRTGCWEVTKVSAAKAQLSSTRRGRGV